MPPALPDVPQVPHGRTARRLEWQHLAPGVRDLVERRLGAPVVEARSQAAGFTPGFASRLTAADGSTAFVKAASRKAQRPFADAYSAEARTLQLLPEGVPAPRLLWSHEDDLWVVLGFECVDGANPRRPWDPAQLDACLDALESVAERLAPVPEQLRLEPLTVVLPRLLTGWEHVRAVDPTWPHLDEAASLSLRAQDLPDSGHFLHLDARDDNFIVDATGKAWLCDWNGPALGPSWADTVFLLVSAFGDGLDADALLASRRLTAEVPADDIDSLIAGFCGFMLEGRDRPVPPSSPYLRVHARWYSEASWAWLCARRGW